jgi:hypothetical protein
MQYERYFLRDGKNDIWSFTSKNSPKEIPHGKLINILYSFSSKIFPWAEKIVKEVNSKRNRSVEGNLKLKNA